MRNSFVVGYRKICQAVLVVAVVVTAVGVCRAQNDGPDNDADDLTFTKSWAVPPDPFPKQKPRGWGALVLTFDTPIENASFVFPPDCPNPADGFIDPASSTDGGLSGTTIQLGPGSYALLPTGSPSDVAGVNYGNFTVTVTYESEAAQPPNITSAFWQAKPKVLDAQNNLVRTWTFNGAQDMMTTVPEPSTLILSGIALFAFAGMRFLRWRRRA